jgi:broad specificity phosphatase PhoE
MATIFLIRHAQVDYPAYRQYGFLPVGLSQNGARQARRLGRYCAAQDVDRIVSSPVERAVETAEIIARALPRYLEIKKDDRLREWELGRLWQGMSWRQVIAKYPRQAALVVMHPERVRLTETMSQAGRRVGEAVAELAKAHPTESIAVVSHGDPIRAFWNIAQNKPMYRVRFLYMPRGAALRLDYDRKGDLASISRVNLRRF